MRGRVSVYLSQNLTGYQNPSLFFQIFKFSGFPLIDSGFPIFFVDLSVKSDLKSP